MSVRKPERILTDGEVIRLFGDPSDYVLSDGSIHSAWEARILTPVKLPAPLPLLGVPGRNVTRYRCHNRIWKIYEAAFAAVYAVPEIWATIGDWGGCYAFRTNRRNPRKLSRHSFGIAHDWDAAENAQGTVGNVHPGLIEIMESHGFYFGGRFKGLARDPMHWEFAAPWLLGQN